MPLIKRDDKRVTRISFLVAVGVNVLAAILAVLFTDVEDIILDKIVEVRSGKNIKPPPPPKRKAPKVNIKKPDAVKPVIKVTPPAVRPNVAPEFEIKLNLGSRMPDPDYTTVAMDMVGSDNMVDMQATDFRGAVGDVFKGVGIDIDPAKTRFSKVQISGSKKRTRGRFSWTLARYKSSYWDAFLSRGGLKNLFFYMNENTFIKIDANARTIDLESTFDFWLKKAKETISVRDKVEKTPENELLDELKRAAYELTKPEMNVKDKYIRLLWDIFDTYLYRKYDFRIKGRPLEAVVDDLKEENVQPWRMAGVKEIIIALEKMEATKKYLDGTELKPLWMFAKKSEVLECPLLYFKGSAGVQSVNYEMIEVLQTYVRNGGFIWIDDGSQATDWSDVRVLIQKIMGDSERDEITEQVYTRLAQNDQSVPGFDLLGNAPEPVIGNTFTYIYFALPEQSPVQVRIYNKFGNLIREYDLGELQSGSYADRKTGLRWDCRNQKNEDVGPGTYFVQIEAGLFRATRKMTVSQLRKLDKTHPLYSAYERFDEVPIGYVPLDKRPFGNVSLGYYYQDHLAIVFNEGNGVTDGTSDGKDAAKKEACAKWMTNIIVFALTQPTGITARK